MRKLTLSIQDLQVATFQTQDRDCAARTCPGWPYGTCVDETCGAGPTCDGYC